LLMSEYIVAIHQGTRNTSCVIFDQQGMPISATQLEHRQIYLRSGWVEHRPLEIWGRVQEVISKTLKKTRIQPKNLVALGITNQRETTIVWDKQTGKPYYNAIVWQDTRTKEFCDHLISKGCRDFFRARTGLPISTYFSGPKIKWILDNVSGVRKAAERGQALFGNIDTWLIWRLTGGPDTGLHITDVTNASRTLLMNLRTLEWDEEICRLLNIPCQMLPRIIPSSDPQRSAWTTLDGPFKAAIPICGDLGDQQAALVGQTCYSPGEAKNTYSTGCFMLLNIGNSPVISKSGLLTTVAYKLGNQDTVYALEGSIASTGALVQWLRDNLGIIRTSSEVEDLARLVDDNGGIYIVPSSSDLYTPYWRSDERGMVAGLSGNINKHHIARAVLETTAYQTRTVLDAMQKDYRVGLKTLKVNGRMVENELLMKFQADILGVPVVKPKVTNISALGAAYAAGLAVGVWNSIDDLRDHWQMERIWKPEMDIETRQKLYDGWLIASRKAVGDAE
jgi:glycerol kinase